MKNVRRASRTVTQKRGIRFSLEKRGGKKFVKATLIYPPAKFGPTQVDFTTPKGLVSLMKHLFAEKRVYYDKSKDPMGAEKLWLRPEIRAELTKKYEGFLFRGFEPYSEPMKESLKALTPKPMIDWLMAHNDPAPEKKARMIFNELKKRINLANSAINQTRTLYAYESEKYGEALIAKRIHQFPELVAMQNVIDLGNLTLPNTIRLGLIIQKLND